MNNQIFYHKFLIKHFESLDSTNLKAWHLAKDYQIDHNHIILADYQSAGKGRLGKNWQSPKGNLYFSLLLKPQKSINQSAQLSFVASTAMGSAIEQLQQKTGKTQNNINLKWPNDILVNNKKVAGILLESDFDSQNLVNFVVLGVGVNINSYPQNTPYLASSLNDEGFVIKDKMELLEKFLDNFSELYQKWLDFGFAPIRNLWIKKAYKLNQKIVANLPNQSLSGIFIDLDLEGNLLLKIDEKVLKISSGEIFN